MKPKLSGCQRAEWNDYHEPRHYMITIVRNDDIDIPFSRIYNGCENNDRPVPVTDLTPLGRIIRDQLFLLPKIFPEMVWQQTAHAQGVFISPFYSKEEKRLMRGFEDEGCRIIKLVDYPFYERFKPQGRDFELCSQGRLLLISIPGFLKNGKMPTRQLCLDLNEQARQISNLMENDWRTRPLRF